MEGVVDIDLFLQSSDVPSTDPCYVFIDRETIQSRMVSMLSCRNLIQGTSTIFNLQYFNSACKMPSKFFLYYIITFCR